MALPAFDSGAHHVGLGVDVANLKGFLAKGYTKSRQRETDRIVQEFGGGRDDLGAAGLSRWNQESFVGGAFQYRVDPQDLARFSNCKNLIPMLQGQGAISVPPMILAKSFNPVAAGYTSHVLNGAPTYVEPKNMFGVAGSVYTVFKHGIFRYVTGTDTLTFSNGNAPDLGAYKNLADACYDQNEQLYWALLGPGATDTTSILRRFRHDFTDPNVGPNFFAGPPEMEDMEARGLAIWGPTGEIIVSIAQRLFTFLPPKKITNTTAVDAGKWTDRGRLPGRWVDSLAYNNRLYILCNEADGQTHLVCWDGIDVLPVCTFSFEFEGWSLVDYGGRIFVVGRGTDVNGGDRYAELHEVTGASNRLVRTFQPEHYNDYPGVGTPKNFKCVMVMDGLLWMPHQGKRLVAYDLTADGFWGASSFAGLEDTNFTIHEMTRGRGGLYGYGSINGVNTNTGLYRIALNTDTPPSYDSVLETSDFDIRPARQKRWSNLLVRTRNQTSATIEYSLDSGTTWTALTVVTTNDADVNEHSCDLSGIPVSKRIRFRFTFPQGTDTSYLVMELLSFSVSFIFLDVNKWAWGLTLISTDRLESYDDDPNTDDVTYNIDEVSDQLEAWAQNTTALLFRDLDLSDHKVQIIDLKKAVPIIGPRHDGNVEAFFTVVLQEV